MRRLLKRILGAGGGTAGVAILFMSMFATDWLWPRDDQIWLRIGAIALLIIGYVALSFWVARKGDPPSSN